MLSSRVRMDIESLTRPRGTFIRHLKLFILFIGLVCLVSTFTYRERIGDIYLAAQRKKVVECSYDGAPCIGRVKVPEVLPPVQELGVGDDGWIKSGEGLNSPPPSSLNASTTSIVDPESGRANATLLMLARNSDLNGVISSMKSLESKFNNRYHYPWTFLNEVPFTLEFKKRVREVASGEVRFGLIRSEDWYPPDWIDEEKYEHDRKEMSKNRVPHIGSVPYRNMCRFNSGFFYRQKVLDGVKWYWRVEPHVNFPCKIPYDPFVYMIENKKRYSFTITIKEYVVTIPTLWDTVKGFMLDYPYLLSDNNSLPFLTNDGRTFSLCHFWSNFEIADLDFFRSPEYNTFFSYLDRTGNFFYERWGDAPVHSIGVGLLLPVEQIHYFHDLGYFHHPKWNCPDEPLNSQLGCTCKKEQAFDVREPKCMQRFKKMFPDRIPG